VFRLVGNVTFSWSEEKVTVSKKTDTGSLFDPINEALFLCTTSYGASMRE